MPSGWKSKGQALVVLGLGLTGYFLGRAVLDGSSEALRPTPPKPERSFDLESDANHAAGLGASSTNPDRSTSPGSKRVTPSRSLSQQHRELLLEYLPPVRVEWHSL